VQPATRDPDADLRNQASHQLLDATDKVGENPMGIRRLLVARPPSRPTDRLQREIETQRSNIAAFTRAASFLLTHNRIIRDRDSRRAVRRKQSFDLTRGIPGIRRNYQESRGAIRRARNCADISGSRERAFRKMLSSAIICQLCEGRSKGDIEGHGSPLRRSCGLHCLIRKSLT